MERQGAVFRVERQEGPFLGWRGKGAVFRVERQFRNPTGSAATVKEK